MKILAIKWRRLGDTILWTSALAALREHFPNDEIDLAFPEAYADLFAADPRFGARFGLHARWRENLTHVREWRRRQYDLALCFHASGRSRLLARLSGARDWIIHHHSRKGKNFGSRHRVINLGKPMAAIERDLNVVRTLGWKGPRPPTEIFCRPDWIATARARLPPSGPVVLMGPGASRPSKHWGLERYDALCARLHGRAEIGILCESEALFAGQERLRSALSAHSRILVTARLSDAIGLLRLARCYAGSDSGIKHLAAALDTPTVTFFGPESTAEWHGYDEGRHRVLRHPVGCRSHDAAGEPGFAWCGEPVCPLGSHACMSLITVDEAAREIQRFL